MHTQAAHEAVSLRVAFQGELGAYSEEAVRRFFGAAADPVARRDFRAVGESVLGGEVDFGLLPIENSLAGSVVASYDVLGAMELVAVGEVISPIHHQVLGLPGARLDGIRRILSHPVALAQCNAFFAAHPGVEAVSHYDTAGAAKTVAEGGDPSVGAIAGAAAAERYGLDILARDVEDRADNQTRFLVVTRAGEERPVARAGSTSGLKTTLLAETANAPGALVRLLLPFAERGVNLSKLESRPAEQPWTYRFFLELDGGADEPAPREAIAEARRHTTSLRVVGSYPRWSE